MTKFIYFKIRGDTFEKKERILLQKKVENKKNVFKRIALHKKRAKNYILKIHSKGNNFLIDLNLSNLFKKILSEEVFSKIFLEKIWEVFSKKRKRSRFSKYIRIGNSPF